MENKFFRYIPEYTQGNYRYNIVSNKDEKSFSFTSIDQSRQLRWVVYDNGMFVDNTNGNIANILECYGFNTTQGCKMLEKKSICRHPGDEYILEFAVFGSTPKTGSLFKDKNATLTSYDCKQICWRNCSCIGFSVLLSNFTGCIFYHGVGWVPIFVPDIDKQLILIENHQDKTSPGSVKTPKKRWRIPVGITVFLVGLMIFCVWKRRTNTRRTNTASQDHGTVGVELPEMEAEIKKFRYEEIESATSYFSIQNKIGQGGFGPVYKGVSDGVEMAIKKLSSTSGQGEEEFKNELKRLSRLQHVNVVKLLGYCIHGEERILIYEYMPNKSLDYHIFGSNDNQKLSWDQRVRVIVGIAHGMDYLQNFSPVRVIHRDLKLSNILLDGNMLPKISDFGLSRDCPDESTRIISPRIAGTLSYLSPEALQGTMSVKSDVYAFGIMMLEVISSTRNTHENLLIELAWKAWQEEQVCDFVDPFLRGACNQDMLKYINIALACVESFPSYRPTMSGILSMLAGERDIPQPKRSQYMIGESSTTDMYSTNGMTITTECGR